jgi:hypothetical protein
MQRILPLRPERRSAKIKGENMAYKALDDVTGVGKCITIRNKYHGSPFDLGVIEDEVSVSDGEQKYFVQRVRLADNIVCDGDPTRYVFRIGYYTQRTDGYFCLGSQYAPMITPAELCGLVNAMAERSWLKQ